MRIPDVWWLCGSVACAQQVIEITRCMTLYPSAPQGLNIGGGGGETREIKIRVRHHEDAARFLEWHNVMGTMLHGEACCRGLFTLGTHVAMAIRMLLHCSKQCSRARGLLWTADATAQ